VHNSEAEVGWEVACLFIAGEDSVNESSKADTSSNESLLDDGKIVAIVTLTQVGSLD